MKQLNSGEASFTGNGAWTRARIQAVGLVLLTGLGVCLCYGLVRPCLPSLVWAGALALIFAPMQMWLERKVKRRNLATALSLLIIGLLVVIPCVWFSQRLAEQAITLPESIQKQIAAGKWHVQSENHPLIARLLAHIEQEYSSPENASMASTWLKTGVSSVVRQSAIAAVQICFTLYFLFYFLRDRVRVLNATRSFLPLSETEITTLFSRVNDTIHATLYGMLALSALQGLLGGLMFCWLGVPSPWFWAVVAAVFAFVPVLDAIVLWLPAAVYLALEGRWGEALGVAALGTLLVRALENFLYPVLVQHRVKVPSERIFIALVGGMVLFGWSGLVLGPVILTMTTTLLEICGKRFSSRQFELPNPNGPGSEPRNSSSKPTAISGAAALPH